MENGWRIKPLPCQVLDIGVDLGDAVDQSKFASLQPAVLQTNHVGADHGFKQWILKACHPRQFPCGKAISTSPCTAQYLFREIARLKNIDSKDFCSS